MPTPATSMSKPALATAIHEAGHVAAAIEMGVGVSGASIIPMPGQRGQVSVPGVRASNRAIFGRIVAAFAGYIAEAELYGTPVEQAYRSAAIDMRHAQQFASMLFPTADARLAGLSLASTTAARIVRTNAGLIRSMATALVEFKRLSALDIARIVAHTQGKPTITTFTRNTRGVLRPSLSYRIKENTHASN